jgi:hypothetical protein
MIHSKSCHPVEHIITGINYLINRITSYPITKCNIITIDFLLKINGYQYPNTKKLIRHKQLSKQEDNNIKPKKWAVFTYTGKDTRFITKLFKEFNINISYRTRNTIGNILANKRPNNNPL